MTTDTLWVWQLSGTVYMYQILQEVGEERNMFVFLRPAYLM